MSEQIPALPPREAMEFDVVIVGAGPAGLATAIRLRQRAIDAGRELSVCILEKGSEPGAHILSGAIMDPRALTELFPDWAERGAPLKQKVTRDEFLFLSETGARGTPHALLPECFHNDGAMLWSGYWVDVTEARAQADALVVAKAAAERAAAAKADFLATMSHEIRTPMSGVLGMVEVLSHTPLDGEQRRIIAVIEDSAQMLRHILDDILDYSRIEAGGLRLELQPVGLRGLLDNVRQLLSPQASVKGLALQLQVDPAVAPMHLGDGMRLRQIVFNLLSNAIKFTDQGFHVGFFDASTACAIDQQAPCRGRWLPDRGQGARSSSRYI